MLVLYRALRTYRILCSSVRLSTINWNLGLRKIIQIPVVQRQGYLHYWMIHGYLLIAFYTIFARYLFEVTKSLFNAWLCCHAQRAFVQIYNFPCCQNFYWQVRFQGFHWSSELFTYSPTFIGQFEQLA